MYNNQNWFWTERWQRMEAEADADIANNRVYYCDNLDDFITQMNQGMSLRCEICRRSLYDTFHKMQVFTTITTDDKIDHYLCSLDANTFMTLPQHAGKIIAVKHTPEMMGG